MANHSGIISWVGEKPYKNIKLYSFALEGETKKYYNLGRDPLGIRVGLMITFDYTVNDRGFLTVDGNSVVLTEVDTPPQDAAPLPEKLKKALHKEYNDTPTYLTKDQYWKNKEDRDVEKDEYFRKKDISISYNGAYNSALAAVSKAIELGIKSLPKTAKGDTAYVAFLGEVDKLASTLFTRYQHVKDNPVDFIEVVDDDVVVVDKENEEEFLSE